MKAAFHWWPSLIRTLLNPQRTSNLVKTLASYSLQWLKQLQHSCLFTDSEEYPQAGLSKGCGKEKETPSLCFL